MIKRIFVCAMMLVASFAVVSAQNVVNNDTILKLLSDGFSSEEIIDALEGESNIQIQWNLDFMNKLKEAGAQQELKDYLRQKANTASAANEVTEPGVYWINPSEGNAPQMIPYNIFTIVEKSSGFLGKVVGGVVSRVILHDSFDFSKAMDAYEIIGSAGFKSEKLKLDGAQASTIISGENGGNPVFRFFLSDFIAEVGDWYAQWFGTVTNPNDFQCVRLIPNEKKNIRTLPSKLNISAVGIDFPVGSNEKVEFNVRQLDSKTYEVTFPNGIEPGEYCFYYSKYQNKYLGKKLIAYDFSVQ